VGICLVGRGVSLDVDQGRVLVRGKGSEMSVATDGVVEPGVSVGLGGWRA
jgi:hypothetical protein